MRSKLVGIPIRTSFAAVVTTAILASSATGQDPASFDPVAFDAYVSAAVNDWGAPGLAVVVVKDGEILFERGYGVLELGRAEAVDEHTRFAIGSTTTIVSQPLCSRQAVSASGPFKQGSPKSDWPP